MTTVADITKGTLNTVVLVQQKVNVEFHKKMYTSAKKFNYFFLDTITNTVFGSKGIEDRDEVMVVGKGLLSADLLTGPILGEYFF